MKDQKITTSRKKRRGFTLVELLVVISIIVILAGIAAPTAVGALKKAERLQAMSNLRNVKGGLDLFATDFGGEYPSDSTAAQLGKLLSDEEPRKKNSSRLEGNWNLESKGLSKKKRQSRETSRTSNDYFEQLMGRGLDTEQLLSHNAFRSTFQLQRSDKDRKVEKGENVWGYTRNLMQTSSGHIPIVFDSPVSTGDSPRFSKKTWEGQILVARLDGSTAPVPISGSDRHEGSVYDDIYGERMNLFSKGSLEEGILVPANLTRIGGGDIEQ